LLNDRVALLSASFMIQFSLFIGQFKIDDWHSINYFDTHNNAF